MELPEYWLGLEKLGMVEADNSKGPFAGKPDSKKLGLLLANLALAAFRSSAVARPEKHLAGTPVSSGQDCLG